MKKVTLPFAMLENANESKEKNILPLTPWKSN